MTVDELSAYGMEQMSDEAVAGFLSSQSLGTLGLPSEDGPYLVPMSYGYDGGSRLYFFYVVGSDSRKADLSDRAETASFLVYSAETMFNWESVSLTGTIRKLPADKRPELDDGASPTWRPELFQEASRSEETQLYEFQIDEWTGIRHTGLPPGLAEDRSK